MSITDLPQEHQYGLGPVLSGATRAIKQVMQPLNIYYAQFGEENCRLHFHLFPRTKFLTEAYWQTFPEQEGVVNGPRLFDWARSEFRESIEEVWEAVSWTFPALRFFINKFSEKNQHVCQKNRNKSDAFEENKERER
jgi:diadenosine tetraphosphate (Ap4A) HIT family hydrolase